jgi:hypothetical protein
MKPAPAPEEHFDNAVGKLLSVPKEAFLKEDAKWKAKNRGAVLAKHPLVALPGKAVIAQAMRIIRFKFRPFASI